MNSLAEQSEEKTAALKQGENGATLQLGVSNCGGTQKMTCGDVPDTP